MNAPAQEMTHDTAISGCTGTRDHSERGLEQQGI
jgi:hypothetical protein